MVRTQDAENKVLNIFNRLKRRAERVQPQIEIAHQSPSTFESGQITPLRNIEPNLAELQQEAMNSYRIGPSIEKTDEGYVVE